MNELINFCFCIELHIVPKGITLTKANEEDLWEIIRRVVPSGPNVRVMVQSDLKNFQK